MYYGFTFSESIVLDQAKKLVEENKIPEDFVRTADDLDDIAQKYKDEIRNQTVTSNYYVTVVDQLFRKYRNGVLLRY